MKNLKYTALLVSAIVLLASCAATSNVADDDVYVSKNPQMSSTEEVNNVSSYENYRYNRDRGTSDIRYRRDNRLFGTSVFIIGSMNNPIYSSYYDPFRYGYGYNTFYDPFNPWNHWGANNYWGNGFGYGYSYNNYGSQWGYSPYGYGSYGYYNPYYNNYYNNVPSGTVSQNYNTHYGPRYSVSGLNNNRRGHSPEAKGIAATNGSRNFKPADAGTNVSKNTRSVEPVTNGRGSNAAASNSEVKNSRSVTSGTGLSRSGRTVSTHSNAQRSSGSYDYNAGRGSIDTRSNSNERPTRSFEPNNSGTTRNSGTTTTSPRSNGAAGGSGGSTVRRGGR